MQPLPAVVGQDGVGALAQEVVVVVAQPGLGQQHEGQGADGDGGGGGGGGTAAVRVQAAVGEGGRGGGEGQGGRRVGDEGHDDVTMSVLTGRTRQTTGVGTGGDVTVSVVTKVRP